jgi:hypothetical protein
MNYWKNLLKFVEPSFLSTEPKFIAILWPAVKVSSGMGLPILYEMSIQRHKVSFLPFPHSSLHLCLQNKPVLEISRQIQNQQERSSPLLSFPFVVGVDS